MFPIMLNIRGRKCTVAGGGNVAERKVKTLLKYGADVTAVSPFFKDGFPNVKRLEKEYSSSDIENSFLVIAATDNKEVNQTIYNDAKKRNILVSLSDDTEHSDFILPSSKNYDDITISVSTNGKSPALAKKIRQIKSNDLEFYASILPIIEKYRSILISESRDTKKEILNFMVSDEMLEIAKESLELYEQKIKEKI
ncbi:MAG: bifunctional precorrin-2 dehydrogenase/sirohydrochlorin ferrochelatase [Hominilimicola sp.]|uniref:precorrin-2 dehydrogenase/sirohydrochlorin ferrochelatase family protein n=1 Tax=Hominilimicola sp. TaxID=3073571 RepID=UPI00399A4BD7